MKSRRLLSTILGLFLASSLGVMAQTQGDNTAEKKDGPPGMLEVTDLHDWGVTAPGKLTADIPIKNTGKGQLQIENVRPSCGCTAAPLDDYLLDPGESTIMHITLDATHREGPLSKSVVIYSDDPNNPTKIVQLKADVRKDVSFEPDVRWLVFSGATVGQEVRTSVRVVNTSDKPITLSPPELQGMNAPVNFNLTSNKTLAPGEGFELVASMVPQEATAISGKAILRTDSENMPFREFTIHANVAEKVSATESAGAFSNEGSTVSTIIKKTDDHKQD